MKHYIRRLLGLTLVCSAIAAGPAMACIVCISLPEDTMTDRLLKAEVVVLARENPEKPFSYAATAVLKGELEDSAIDLFLNSSLRRRLSVNPGHAIVLAFDEATNHWQSVGYASPSFEALVKEILARAPAWEQSTDQETRAQFFLPYLADEERAVHRLAYLEVGQASYDLIRMADRFVTKQQVQAFLADPRYLAWHGLYILLLGVDAGPVEADRIRQAMASYAQIDLWTNLSAWATALIEVDGVAAIDWLEATYLANSSRHPDAVLEIVKALSVHGARPQSGLRPRITQSYGLLIESHPLLAGWAAHDLTAWEDWRFAEILGQLRERNTAIEGATAYAIDYYVGRARSTGLN
jgi:hypothetical protein